MNRINRLFYCTPLWRNVAGLAFGEEFFEHLRDIIRRAEFHQIAGEMRTGDGSAIGQTQRAFPGTVNACFRQPVAHFLRALLTQTGLRTEQTHHRRMLRINAQPDNVDLMVFPQSGNLNAINQHQRQLLLRNRLRRTCQPFGTVVIGDRQYADAHFNRPRDQCFRR